MDSQTEKQTGWGEVHWKLKIKIYTVLIYTNITQTANKDLVYSTENYIQYPVMTCNGG